MYLPFRYAFIIITKSLLAQHFCICTCFYNLYGLSPMYMAGVRAQLPGVGYLIFDHGGEC